MDQPGLDEEQHRVALRALERINRLSFSARIFWPPLERLARRLHPQPCRVLDVATGGGDVLRGLWRKAQRANLAFQFAGCDISPAALRLAEQNARADGAEVRFFACDILAEQLPAEYDAIITSLFLHHLEEEKAIELLRRMAGAARCLVLVNDLERCRLGYLLAWLGTRLLTRSPIVHVDGPRSVEGAFSKREALALAHRAGLEAAAIGRRWPCRYLLSWERPGVFA
jgi:2-polyprenyl-3-methyl-5-hydroxy-6-metoxy-1,4-benzoquinol methylase